VTHICGSMTWIFLFFVAILGSSVSGYHTGDRILASVQTLHAEWRTPHLDMALNQLPTFRQDSTVVLKVPFPRTDGLGPEMLLNDKEDVKLAFAFAHRKLVVPWTLAYGADTRRYLTRVTFAFAHDEFDVLRVHAVPTYAKPPLNEEEGRLPPVELVYAFEVVQEEDVASGLFYMFSLSLASFAVLVYIVMGTYDQRFEPRSRQRGGGGGGRNKGSKPRVS